MARKFGATWWGRAWIEALEMRARLDPNRLPRGRTYARQDRAEAVEVRPGEIRAVVHGSRRTPYRVIIGVRRFDRSEWDGFLAAVVARAGHAAALLDGELDPGVVDDARRSGVELLPGPGDLTPRCSCPDWADPCKHSAAVCYLMADEMDADPFALLLLRGRGRDEVLAELRRLRSGDAARAPAPAATDTTMRASEAWKRATGPLPPAPSVRSRPGLAPVWASDPPPDVGFDAASLTSLVADAAHRAWTVLRGEGSTGLDLDTDADLARRADRAAGRDDWERLTQASGLDRRRLERMAAGWRHGGTAGVRAATAEPFRADARVMATARQALVEAGAPGRRVKTRLNTVTVGDVQVRLGPDGRWWRFERRGGAWELAAPPADDADDLWW